MGGAPHCTATPTIIMSISVLIATYNEENRIKACLSSMAPYRDLLDEVIVIDSQSTDQTTDIAKKCGAAVIPFTWNGQYPKKRQWILDTIPTKNDWIFFLDADEHVTEDFVREVRQVSFDYAGYFVRGHYIINGQPLKYGLQNNKLALLNRHKFIFPVIDDLRIKEMGEMEGHYQPILKANNQTQMIGQIKSPIIHDAYGDQYAWKKRHGRYAKWEAYMIKHKAYPIDPRPFRQLIKSIFRHMPFRPLIAFLHSYVMKRGFLDGASGFELASSRYHYYRRVDYFLKNQ